MPSFMSKDGVRASGQVLTDVAAQLAGALADRCAPPMGSVVSSGNPGMLDGHYVAPGYMDYVAWNTAHPDCPQLDPATGRPRVTAQSSSGSNYTIAIIGIGAALTAVYFIGKR